MTYLTLDIETVPQARYVDPANYACYERPGLETVDDEGAPIASDRAIRNGECWLKATGVCPSLHATTCHVVQVSFGWRENPDGDANSRVIQSDTYLASGEGPAVAEKAVLCDAFDVLARAAKKRSVLVTFNGKGFDLPILRARAALLRLDVPKLPWRRLLYPYSDEQHADLRLILGNDNRYAKGTLQWWAEAFGIHAEEHGAEVWGWVQAGEWEKLRQYGHTEARTLVGLYEAAAPIL